MTCEEEVLAAPNPQAALLAVARALDRLAVAPARVDDGWGEWGTVPVDGATQIIQNGDTAEVVLPKPNPDRYITRYAFARDTLDLPTALGGDEDWCEHYANGGPMWLYLGNRDLVMQYPREVRRQMIEDVEQDSVKDAEDMARDVMKIPTDDVPKVTLNDAT